MVNQVNKPFDWGVHRVHASWQRLLPPALKNWTPPRESKATCFNCPKVQSHGFDRLLKCCTYHPKVPNYQLGDALKAGGDSAQAVRDMIAGRYLLPEGSGHTPMQWLDVLQQDQAKSYGRAGKTVCGFLDREKGLCRIYGYRNSACTTYFCRHDESWGENFWEYVHHWLGRSELALTQYSLKEAGFDYEAFVARFNKLSSLPVTETCHSDDRSWREEVLANLWGDWSGREEELFVKCSDIVEAIEDISEIVMTEKLVEPNLMEVSSMEARYGDDEREPVDIQTVWNNLTKFSKRVAKDAQ